MAFPSYLTANISALKNQDRGACSSQKPASIHFSWGRFSFFPGFFGSCGCLPCCGEKVGDAPSVFWFRLELSGICPSVQSLPCFVLVCFPPGRIARRMRGDRLHPPF